MALTKEELQKFISSEQEIIGISVNKYYYPVLVAYEMNIKEVDENEVVVVAYEVELDFNSESVKLVSQHNFTVADLIGKEVEFFKSTEMSIENVTPLSQFYRYT